MHYNSIIFAAFAVILPLRAMSQTTTIASPDGKIKMVVENGDKLSYSVSYQDQPMVEPSHLGFDLKGEKPMGESFQLVSQPRIEHKTERWTPVVALKHHVVDAEWNEATFQLKEKGNDFRRMDLQVRVYNDGVAFRFQLFDRHAIGSRYITQENTEFAIPAGAQVWLAQHRGRYQGSQEVNFKKTSIDSISTQTVAQLPFLIEVSPSAYMAIMDANVDDYPGFFIGAKSPRVLTAKLAPMLGEPESGVKAQFDGEKWTPWRVLMIGSQAGKLIESEIVRNLNPPCALKDVSWIKPGMSAWDHWWSGEVKMDMPTIKQYIDLAAAQGWPYMLIDWQWYGAYNKTSADVTTPAKQLDMQELVNYAKARYVRLWLWLYSSDITHNSIYEKAFPLYEKWGIAGIKIDFMNRMDQDMTRWYKKICQKAAEHHLMVDFHGAYRPDGIQRTYPNLLTREGVLGEEYYKFSTRVTPEHNVNLAFTRLLAGPMDYTPGGFLNTRFEDLPAEKQEKLKAGKTIIPAVVFNTRAAELAKFVVYESPFMVVSDHPKHILGQVGADLLKKVPTTWDDTRFLCGQPGEYVALARQKDGVWYVGVINNSSQRSIKLDLRFLPKGEYRLECWKDGNKANKRPTDCQHEIRKVSSSRPLLVKMSQAGGFVGILSAIH